MTEAVRFELAGFALARTGSTPDEDPRGWAGETVWYGTRGAPAEARLVVLAKLPPLALGEGHGISATGENDAAASGISNLFDAVSFRMPRQPWKVDLERCFADRLSLETWAAATITVDDTAREAFRLDYADAAVHVADVGDVYIIVVTVPPVETPSVRRL